MGRAPGPWSRLSYLRHDVHRNMSLVYNNSRFRKHDTLSNTTNKKAFCLKRGVLLDQRFRLLNVCFFRPESAKKGAVFQTGVQAWM